MILRDPMLLTGAALLSIALGKTAMFIVGGILLAMAVLSPLR
jgi:hypothetical protein